METIKKNHNKLTRKIFNKIHLGQISSKQGLKKMKNLLTIKNMMLNKNYFKNKICADFGCGSTGAGAYNLLKLGSKFVHLLDMDAHIINPINKNLKYFKNRYKISIGAIEKAPYENNYFDFILCQGVLHHALDEDKCLKEIYKKLKGGGKFLLTIHGDGGLINNFTMKVARQEYRKNKFFKMVLDNIFNGKIDSYKRFFYNNYDNRTRKLVQYLKKFIDKDMILTIQDRILAPKYKTFKEENLKKKLKKIGFKRIYRIKKEIKYKNLRTLLAPLYYHHNHEVSKALYGDGIISLIMQK
jgi:SAM-dependent methyltransferase